jgi:uncharacterized membrane protein
MFSENKWDSHLLRISIIAVLSYVASILYLMIIGDPWNIETMFLVSLYVILIVLGLFALIIALNTNVYAKNKMVNDISGA